MTEEGTPGLRILDIDAQEAGILAYAIDSKISEQVQSKPQPGTPITATARG